MLLRNRYTKYIGGIGAKQKIIHNKPHEGVVFLYKHRRVKSVNPFSGYDR